MEPDLETYLQELRRGTVVLACLKLLHAPGYGYGLLAELERRGFATDANTLYPLLRRLEKQGYLTSEWNTEGARPRKFYRTSAAGTRLAEALTREWSTITGAVDTLTGAGGTPAGAAGASTGAVDALSGGGDTADSDAGAIADGDAGTTGSPPHLT